MDAVVLPYHWDNRQKLYNDYQYLNNICADGLGVSEIKKLGIQQAIISTEKNPVVAARARKLAIPCLQGINNKKNALIDFCLEKDIELGCVVYVGNDINDKDAMQAVTYTFCPADAHDSIKRISDHVFNKKGGDGVIRELFDFLITKESQNE